MTNDFEGLTKSQVSLVEYWNNRSAARGVFTRADIDPGALRVFLKSILLMDISSVEPVCRIAGSAFREKLGEELRGRRLSEMPFEIREAWALGTSQACSTQKPAGGLCVKGEAVHAWLRLPVFNATGQLTQILCHDEVLTGDALREEVYDASGFIPGRAAAAA